MAAKRKPKDRSEELMPFLGAIASSDEDEALRLLKATPALAGQVMASGATRLGPNIYFFREIAHYVYAGDTALHVAAAAYDRKIAQKLVALGARLNAANRRGQTPLHYAADGGPGASNWDPKAQAAIVEYLIEAGADPNAADRGGTTPLHRAVRNRCTGAVTALLAGGADPGSQNKSGSTPPDLAVLTTGRGGTGSCLAKVEQKEIIRLLKEHGTLPARRR